MKRTLAFILVALMIASSLCGCKASDGIGGSTTTTTTTTTTTGLTTTTTSASATTTTTTGQADDQDIEAETLREKLLREIEGVYLEEQKLPEYSTTLGMIELADTYTEKWKQVADEYYNKIMEAEIEEYDESVQPNYSSDDLHTFVSNMKTSWEKYYQEQCDNYYKVLKANYGPGTIVGPIFANYKYEMQKEWALRILDIYQQVA